MDFFFNINELFFSPKFQSNYLNKLKRVRKDQARNVESINLNRFRKLKLKQLEKDSDKVNCVLDLAYLKKHPPKVTIGLHTHHSDFNFSLFLMKIILFALFFSLKTSRDSGFIQKIVKEFDVYFNLASFTLFLYLIGFSYVVKCLFSIIRISFSKPSPLIAVYRWRGKTLFFYASIICFSSNLLLIIYKVCLLNIIKIVSDFTASPVQKTVQANLINSETNEEAERSLLRSLLEICEMRWLVANYMIVTSALVLTRLFQLMVKFNKECFESPVSLLVHTLKCYLNIIVNFIQLLRKKPSPVRNGLCQPKNLCGSLDKLKISPITRKLSQARELRNTGTIKKFYDDDVKTCDNSFIKQDDNLDNPCERKDDSKDSSFDNQNEQTNIHQAEQISLLEIKEICEDDSTCICDNEKSVKLTLNSSAMATKTEPRDFPVSTFSNSAESIFNHRHGTDNSTLDQWIRPTSEQETVECSREGQYSSVPVKEANLFLPEQSADKPIKLQRKNSNTNILSGLRADESLTKWLEKVDLELSFLSENVLEKRSCFQMSRKSSSMMDCRRASKPFKSRRSSSLMDCRKDVDSIEEPNKFDEVEEMPEYPNKYEKTTNYISSFIGAETIGLSVYFGSMLIAGFFIASSLKS